MVLDGLLHGRVGQCQVLLRHRGSSIHGSIHPELIHRYRPRSSRCPGRADDTPTLSALVARVLSLHVISSGCRQCALQTDRRKTGSETHKDLRKNKTHKRLKRTCVFFELAIQSNVHAFVVECWQSTLFFFKVNEF